MRTQVEANLRRSTECAGGFFLAKRNAASLMNIITLLTELAPKVIGAGKSVVYLRQSASGIIAAAEKTGSVDADAVPPLKALINARLAAQYDVDEEARWLAAGRKSIESMLNQSRIMWNLADEFLQAVDRTPHC